MGKTTTYAVLNFFLTTLLLLTTLSVSYAQKTTGKKLTQSEKEAMQIYPGFYVTAKHNDTVYGEIQFLNPTFNELTLIFYKDGVRKEFYPADGEIAEYAFQFRKYNKQTHTIEPHWFIYVRKLVPKSPIKGGTKEVFLERQVHGDITLYNYYVLQTSKINSRRYKHNYFVEKQGAGGFALKSIDRRNYRKMLRRHLILGNEELEENLGTSGFGYKYLADIVQIQNAWVAGNPEYWALMNKSEDISQYTVIPEGNVDLESNKRKLKTSEGIVVPEGKVETKEDKEEVADTDMD